MAKVIEVKDLHIRYRSISPVAVKSGMRDVAGKRVDNFEAVKGITFDVERGEIVGIIGENGSGKSTTLLGVAGIFSPDQGSIDTHGHSVSLLAIGVGFQKLLTGRVNIFLSGLLLGFTKKEIEAKMQEIIDFSELGSFIDKPVKTYSSGMYSKLAFAITAILETDIMLIDEVLSVGDAKFKKKSFKKMKELIAHKDRTVLIVSHSIDTLKELCDRVIWMHKGKIKKIGPADDVLREYMEAIS